MTQAEWYVVPSGRHQGEWHLAGWQLSAIKGEATGSRDDGWLAYGCCPRCHVLVIADDEHLYGDLTWAHEQWHAKTDYPIPQERS